MTVVEAGRRDHRWCEVEHESTIHREETTGLWRCVRCGYAKDERFVPDTLRQVEP